MKTYQMASWYWGDSEVISPDGTPYEKLYICGPEGALRYLGVSQRSVVVKSSLTEIQHHFHQEFPRVWLSNAFIYLEGVVVVHNWPAHGDLPSIVVLAPGAKAIMYFGDEDVKLVHAPQWLTPERAAEYSEDEFRRMAKVLSMR